PRIPLPLPLRNLPTRRSSDLDQAKIGVHRAFGSAWLRIGAVKGYADGSLGSTTAYFFQPYFDAPDTRGLLSDEMQDVGQMRTRLNRKSTRLNSSHSQISYAVF